MTVWVALAASFCHSDPGFIIPALPSQHVASFLSCFMAPVAATSTAFMQQEEKGEGLPIYSFVGGIAKSYPILPPSPWPDS